MTEGGHGRKAGTVGNKRTRDTTLGTRRLTGGFLRQPSARAMEKLGLEHGADQGPCQPR